jgi:hypothetical protein
MFILSQNQKFLAMGAILVGALMIRTSAQALPLLSENAAKAFSSNEALTIYPDSDDYAKFYYFPNSSSLVNGRDGTPEFSLAYAGVDAGIPDAEGVLTATFHLQSSPEQKAALQQFLNTHPGAGIATIPVMASTLSMGGSNGKKAPMSYFKTVQLPEFGGLADSDVGFSAELSGIGVKLVKAQIKGDTAQGLQSCYKIQGLGPNMDAHVTIHWSQVYDYMAAHLSVGGWYWHVDIQKVTEELQTQGSVRIVINGGTATQQDYVNKVADEIIQKFFVPDFAASPDSAGNNIFSNTPLQFSLSTTHKEDVKDFEGNWVIRDLTTREFCIVLNLTDVAPYVGSKVVDADKM